MKAFKLNPAAGRSRLTVFGRLVVANQVLRMSDKDAKKYLEHVLEGKQSFVECDEVEGKAEVVTTVQATGVDAEPKDAKAPDTSADDVESI
ncbi:hypothetical protein VH22019_00086 [Vibrio phage VH2_2019]|nr:hypothetical protein VH22019_00086 [Vibrio phage VH2_2019]